MINQQSFLEKYNITAEQFAQSGLQWEALEAICQDYESYKGELEPIAIFLFNTLMKAPKVHSVRYRIKDAEHVVEKIIRKRIESANSSITIENYKEELTDLIGLRALHLYKADWEAVNDYIRATWNLIQEPIANYRKGDAEGIIDFYKTKGCQTKEHKYGYRSVHYLLESQPAKKKYAAEIQVRTIFEEAWAEIDHTIRYPYHLENSIFFQFLLILNRLAGSADEMGSFILLLKGELLTKEAEFNKQLDEKSKVIMDLEEKINKLNLQGQELEDVKKDLDKLRNQRITGSLFDTSKFEDLMTTIGTFRPSDDILKLSESFKTISKLTEFPKFDLTVPPTFTNRINKISGSGTPQDEQKD